MAETPALVAVSEGWEARHAALKIAVDRQTPSSRSAADLVAEAAVFAAYLIGGTVPDRPVHPADTLTEFLRLVRDGRVTTKNGQVIDYDTPTSNFTYTSLAQGAEAAGLIVYATLSQWWELTPRGVEAADRGAI
jgi:hypothetical protein